MTKIERKAWVQRHNPMIRGVEPLSPLSVGNGEFAFTADFTGLQSFPERYEVPLGTQSQWGWHSSGGRAKVRLEDIELTAYDTYGRPVSYPVRSRGQEDVFHWLRQNPHRLHLAQVGFAFLDDRGKRVAIGQVRPVTQRLDLWSGMLDSRYEVLGETVHVITYCHPQLDQVAIRVESSCIRRGRLRIEVRFPSPQVTDDEWSRAIAWNWTADDNHHTDAVMREETAVFERTMDEDSYRMVALHDRGEWSRLGEHHYVLEPLAGTEVFEFCFGFSSLEMPLTLAAFADTAIESAAYWERFWQEGGAVECADSRDPRGVELERRIVLSQYLTAIHCAGSKPPQETGLLYNSWFGKFHLEMHWWHGAHFPLWGRAHLLQRSLAWYREILPVAQQLAHDQGYRGARWPKMVGPDGVQSPSGIGAVLIWQQPHPIMLAELVYRANPSRMVLEMYRDIVMESAEFMASFAVWDEARRRYALGPPLIPAQERHKPESTLNPTYELEYWRYGLDVALRWRERLGLPNVPHWAQVRDSLAQLPSLEDVYLAHENCPDTFERANIDHPSMLGALGMLPGEKVDRKTMRNTLQRVMTDWQWNTSWGWDFPMAAMTAARLGEGQWAVDLLLQEAVKNTYLPNGHNYQRPGLFAYLPGNGGLLTAVAMMACGWDGYGDALHAPGFPQDGSWTVRSEGLKPIL